MSVFDAQTTEEFEKDETVGQSGQFSDLRVGAGESGGGFTKEGFFVGGDSWDSARYRQDYNGKVEITDSSGNVVILIDPNG